MSNRFYMKNLGIVYKTFAIYQDPAERNEPLEQANEDKPCTLSAARITEHSNEGNKDQKSASAADQSAAMMSFLESNMSDISALSQSQQRKLKEQILVIIENLLEKVREGKH